MNKLEIFERFPKNKNAYLLYKSNIQNKFNLKFLNKKFIKINNFCDLKNYDNFICYSFEILKKWINKNEIYNEKYIYFLEKYIQKLHLKDLLNTNEQEYLLHFKAVVFSKKRNLKSLIVDFPLEKNDYLISNHGANNLQNNFSRKILTNESAYFTFDVCYFFESTSNMNLKVKGQVYITTHRIVFVTQFKFFSFYFDNINFYKLSKYGFSFIYFDKTYYIDTLDKYVFYVSFERMKYFKK